MGNTGTISKWGNARGIRLPKSFCDMLDFRTGDKVDISIDGYRIVIGKPEERYTIQARMRSGDGCRHDAPEIDWGPPVGKEIW